MKTTIIEDVVAFMHCEHCIVGDARVNLNMRTNRATPDHACRGCGGALCRICAVDVTACRCEPVDDEEKG